MAEGERRVGPAYGTSFTYDEDVAKRLFWAASRRSFQPEHWVGVAGLMFFGWLLGMGLGAIGWAMALVPICVLVGLGIHRLQELVRGARELSGKVIQFTIDESGLGWITNDSVSQHQWTALGEVVFQPEYLEVRWKGGARTIVPGDAVNNEGRSMLRHFAEAHGVKVTGRPH